MNTGFHVKIGEWSKRTDELLKLKLTAECNQS
jgi:hypothetical protein